MDEIRDHRVETGRLRLLCEAPLALRFHLVDVPLADRGEQPLPGAEVVVHRRVVRLPRGADDVAHLCAMDALGGKQPLARREQFRARPCCVDGHPSSILVTSVIRSVEGGVMARIAGDVTRYDPYDR